MPSYSRIVETSSNSSNNLEISLCMFLNAQCMGFFFCCCFLHISLSSKALPLHFYFASLQKAWRYCNICISFLNSVAETLCGFYSLINKQKKLPALTDDFRSCRSCLPWLSQPAVSCCALKSCTAVRNSKKNTCVDPFKRHQG